MFKKRMKSVQIVIEAWRVAKQVATDEEKTIGEIIAECIFYRYGENY